MPINIDNLTEAELRDLNYRIIERLRVMHQLRAHGAMMEFSIGDRVAFTADGREVAGMLIRYNRKTVTVVTDSGQRWNVSPNLMRLVSRAPGRQKTVVVDVTDRAGQQPLLPQLE